MQYFDLMKKACDSVGMEFNEDKYQKFMLYKDLLKEWNEKINLTAITEDEEIVKKHFIDCIKAFKADEFKKAKTVIDVGTGAGFPGLPIAIMREDVEVTLLDSLNKRVNFLNEVVNKLVANMCVLSEFCIPYVKVNGNFIALKGPNITEELNDSKNAIGTLGGKLKGITEVEIEGTDLNHNLVIVDKIKSTPKTFPRKAGNVTKKPLK